MSMTKSRKFGCWLAAFVAAGVGAHFLAASAARADAADALAAKMHAEMTKAVTDANKSLASGPHMKQKPVTVETDNSLTYSYVYDAGFGPASANVMLPQLTNVYCSPAFEFYRNKGVAINWNYESNLGVPFVRVTTKPSDCH